jgi:hypothetical protein
MGEKRFWDLSLRDHSGHATLFVAICNLKLSLSSRSARGDRGPRQRTGAGERCRPASARRRARCRQGQPLPSQERPRRVRLGTSRSPGASGVSNTSRAHSTSWTLGGSRTYGPSRVGFRSVGPSAPDSPGAAPDLEARPDHRAASGDRSHPAAHRPRQHRPRGAREALGWPRAWRRRCGPRPRTCALAIVAAVVPLAVAQIPDAIAWSLPPRLAAGGRMR